MSVAPATPLPHTGTGRAAFPVMEIFGPTVQGEGPDAGIPAYFVRFGGCDWRCTWCDSMHAVEPAEVRANSERLTVGEIIERLRSLPAGPDLVVLSGGNPALLDLADLVAQLKSRRLRVAVETQGSRWQPWLSEVDRLVVSPKPPSSGMADGKQRAQVEAFMAHAYALAPGLAALKIVVFDKRDLDWAAEQHDAYPNLPLFLSAGTDVGLDETTTLSRLCDRFRWLCETVSRRPDLSSARVLPQLHVIAWGTAKGV